MIPRLCVALSISFQTKKFANTVTAVSTESIRLKQSRNVASAPIQISNGKRAEW